MEKYLNMWEAGMEDSVHHFTFYTKASVAYSSYHSGLEKNGLFWGTNIFTSTRVMWTMFLLFLGGSQFFH